MKYTQMITGCILALCGLAACTGGSEKAAENKADTAVARPVDLFSLAPPGHSVPGSTDPYLAVAPIYFGKAPDIKRVDPITECPPGPGICSGLRIGRDTSNIDTLQVIANTFTIRMSRTSMEGTNPAFYASLQRNGVMSFENTFSVDTAICDSVGNFTGITMGPGSPMVLTQMGGDPDGMVGLSFPGAIPGNSSNLIFKNCTGTTYSWEISFSPFNANEGCPGYTGFINNEDGSGTLIIYMQAQSVISQSGISCILPTDTNPPAITSHPFSPARRFVFNDPAIAASMSVPQGWVIPRVEGTIFFYPSGWCSLELKVVQPQGADAEK